jgi:hypothetical protein
MVPRNSIDLFYQFIPHNEIFSGQDYNKFIPSDPENRTMAENTAYLIAGVLDTSIAFLMAIQIIDCFQVVDITDNNCE